MSQILEKSLIAEYKKNGAILIKGKFDKNWMNKLKEGFKKVYGNTVYAYLLEHKMNVASQMLTSKNYNVNEVSQHLGYSSASHFINAFKKRFGITPKKYLN